MKSSTLPGARAVLADAKARFVRASIRESGRLPPSEDYRAAYDRYSRAAGRLAVLLAEAGENPREVEAHHDLGAGALIGMSGASRERRAAAQETLRKFPPVTFR